MHFDLILQFFPNWGPRGSQKTSGDLERLLSFLRLAVFYTLLLFIFVFCENIFIVTYIILSRGTLFEALCCKGPLCQII